MAAEFDWYRGVVAGICRGIHQPTYIEIGVNDGLTIRQVAAMASDAVLFGIDVVDNSHHMPPNTHFFHGSSDDFFKKNPYLEADVIFIDGEHRYDWVERDVTNGIKLLKDSGVLIMHDTWPTHMNEVTGIGDAQGFLGDAYRVADEHKALTLPIYPGLTFITKWQERLIAVPG